MNKQLKLWLSNPELVRARLIVPDSIPEQHEGPKSGPNQARWRPRMVDLPLGSFPLLEGFSSWESFSSWERSSPRSVLLQGVVRTTLYSRALTW
jgi:hypothetical protein